jgi:hypothetical protein
MTRCVCELFTRTLVLRLIWGFPTFKDVKTCFPAGGGACPILHLILSFPEPCSKETVRYSNASNVSPLLLTPSVLCSNDGLSGTQQV